MGANASIDGLREITGVRLTLLRATKDLAKFALRWVDPMFRAEVEAASDPLFMATRLAIRWKCHRYGQ